MMRLVALTIAVLAGGSALAAGPAFWDSPQEVPFADGELAGAAIDAQGRVVAGLAAETVLADSSLVFWTATQDREGRFWLGSGHDGHLWRLDRKNRPELVADLQSEEIFALLPAGDGVLAGCGPGGEIVQVDRDGSTEILGTVPGGYVWDLVRADDGTVYAATGSPAAIYRLTTRGDLEQVVELPCSNALDIALTDQGDLLVAAQGPGRVFRVDPRRGDLQMVLALDQDEVRQVLAGPDGWYALGYQAEPGGNGNGSGSGNGNGGDSGLGGGSPFDIMITADHDVKAVRSVLYRIDGAVPERVWSSEHVLGSVAWSGDHGWIAAGARDQDRPSTLYSLVMPNDRRPLAGWDGGDVVELVVVAQGGKPDEVLALQAHPGRVTRLRKAKKNEAQLVSAPLDSRTMARWSRLTWHGMTGGGDPRFAARTGMSPTPDDTWSDWRDLGKKRDLDLDSIDASRAMQWRLTIPPGSRVDAVTVSAVEPNLPPSIANFGIEAAVDLLAGGMLQSPPNMTQRFRSGLQVEYNVPSRRDRRVSRQTAAEMRPLRTVVWHATDPNHDRLVHQIHYRLRGQDAWMPVTSPTTEQVLTWDTRQLADDWYELRLTTSDRADNPAHAALRDVRTLGPVSVDNTAPELKKWTLEPHTAGFTVALEAEDGFGPLAGAEIELPDGVTERLDPRDGVCDQRREKFELEITYPRAWSTPPVRPWTVRVRVWDLAGNVTEKSGVLP